MPTITIVAHDFLQRLTNGTKERAFALSLPCIGKFPLPDPVIAGLVGVTDLLIPSIDPAGAALSFLTLLIAYAIDPLEAKRAIRVQQGQSDFDFLSMLAKENGWEMYIDHTEEPQGYVLRFQFLIQDYTPSVTLKWGESLSEFTPKITTVGQVAGISTRIWVASIKMEFVIVLSWDYDRAAFDLMIYPGFGSLDELIGAKAQGVLKIDAFGPATAPKKILGELLPRLNNRITRQRQHDRRSADQGHQGDQLRRARTTRRPLSGDLSDAHARQQRLPDPVRRAQRSVVRLNPGAEGRRRSPPVQGQTIG